MELYGDILIPAKLTGKPSGRDVTMREDRGSQSLL